MLEDREQRNDLFVGLGGVRRNGCAALSTEDKILGICEQERITRVRAAGFNQSGVPDEAVDELLRRVNRQRQDISKYVLAEYVPLAKEHEFVRLDHHLAHACSAFLSSPFESATILVCDHEGPQVSVWEGQGSKVTRIEWPWHGPGFAEIYSRCAETLGFVGAGREQKMEALARLDPLRRDDRVERLFALESDRFRLVPNWQSQIEDWSRVDEFGRIVVAASIQSRLGDLLIDFLTPLLRRFGASRPLCLGGSLFFNSYLNARVKRYAEPQKVFVPVNPGNAGLAVGAALHFSGGRREVVTPFLGPRYRPEEIKATFDNCKLNYEWASSSDLIGMAVKDLQKGRLVAWFEGAMEWGPRALGGRSILANPFVPHVLDNLNRFLKQRDPWRGYALSGLDDAVHKDFDGSGASPFMECDFAPHDSEIFRHILPSPGATIRVQTVGGGTPTMFRELLEAFGKETSHPYLVNTSFNGFREPIVCNPRDAIKVFFGTGIDTLVVDKFIIRK